MHGAVLRHACGDRHASLLDRLQKRLKGRNKKSEGGHRKRVITKVNNGRNMNIGGHLWMKNLIKQALIKYHWVTMNKIRVTLTAPFF